MDLRDVMRKDSPAWHDGTSGFDGMDHPQKRQLPDGTRVLRRLRSSCGRFSDVKERDDGNAGNPTYTVGDRIFALHQRVDGRVAIWCKGAPGVQEGLIGSDPERFFAPPYVGRHGWIGIWLDVAPEWERIDALIEESYRQTAPARLVSSIKVGGSASGSTERMPTAETCPIVPGAYRRDHIGHSV